MKPRALGSAGLVASALVWAWGMGCGSRTTLELGREVAGSGEGGDGGQPGSAGGESPGMGGGALVVTVTTTGPMPCLGDDECDDGVACTVDVCDATGCKSTPDHAACDDGLACTLDRCEAFGCSSFASPAACDDGLPCTSDDCDEARNLCLNEPCDSLCDDGVFCNGVERCDNALGCVAGPNACDLGIACADDSCQEATDRCGHVFPASCDRPDVALLVTDDLGRLFRVSPFETPVLTLVAASAGPIHVDVAILDDRWFVIDDDLLEITPFTNDVIDDLGPLGANSLGAGPDGFLYAAQTNVIQIDPDTGAKTAIATLPPQHTSSGDIAFLGTRMFVSTDSPCGGAIVEVDIMTGESAVHGGDGLGCVWGLANVAGRLFLVNCDGSVGIFQPDSGEMRVLASTSITVYGADAL